MNAFYYKPPFRAGREEDFLTAALMEKTGGDRYPGDFVPSANWPNVGPGVLGPVNCWSPKYLRNEAADLLATEPKPPVLWIRGDSDMIVSDNSMFDMAALGKLGYVPGWPGDEVVPPAADDRPDARRAGALRCGRRQLSRDPAGRLCPLAAYREAG